MNLYWPTLVLGKGVGLALEAITSVPKLQLHGDPW